jgi:hypothetical protein
MENKMLDVEGRVKRYWYSDGIADISVGAMFLMLGLFFGVQGYFGEGSTVSVILQVSMVLVMVGGIFGVQWLVNTLKSRLTYPRTGYVEYRAKDKDSNQRRFVVIGVALIIAVASIVLFDFIRELDTMVLTSGILVGIVFIALRGKSTGVTRFYVLGVIAIILGVGLSLGDLSQEYNLALFYGLEGIMLMITGGIVLQRYISENPMPADEDGDDE